MFAKFAGVAALCGLAVAASPAYAEVWVCSSKDTGSIPTKFVVDGNQLKFGDGRGLQIVLNDDLGLVAAGGVTAAGSDAVTANTVIINKKTWDFSQTSDLAGPERKYGENVFSWKGMCTKV